MELPLTRDAERVTLKVGKAMGDKYDLVVKFRREGDGRIAQLQLHSLSVTSHWSACDGLSFVLQRQVEMGEEGVRKRVDWQR